MLWVTLCLLGAACLPPAPRVAGFVAGGSVALLLYWRQLASELIAAQLALYLSGAAAFLRNGGHDRRVAASLAALPMLPPQPRPQLLPRLPPCRLPPCLGL
jgi:hypothetical protein